MSRALLGDSSSNSSRISFSQAMRASLAIVLSSQITAGGSCEWLLLWPPPLVSPPYAYAYSFEVCQIKYQHRISQTFRTRLFGSIQADDFFFAGLEDAP